MSKHTPGPWEADQVGQVWGKINNRDVRVADMGSFNMNANARLIAAAPELLEACRHAEAILGRIIEGKEWGAIEEYADTVRAAIAKAEGRDHD